MGDVRGAPGIRVLVERATPDVGDRIPASLDGFPVEVVTTGEVRALDQR